MAAALSFGQIRLVLPRFALLPLLLTAGCHRTDDAPSASKLVHEVTPGATPVAPVASPPRSVPHIGLDGTASGLEPLPDASGPRVYSKALRTWVFAAASATANKLGYLRAGASSPTSAAAAGSAGCPGGWFPIEPEGFVCVGPTATLDAHDRVVVAAHGLGPDLSRRLPFIYGTVRRPGPIYGRAPTLTEVRSAEPDLDERMQAYLAAQDETGAHYAPQVWLNGTGEPPDPEQAWRAHRSDPLPAFLSGAGNDGPAVVDRMRPKVGYSLLTTFLLDGRRYGVTTDQTLVPTDRLRPIQGSSFHGVEIGKDVELPFVFVRAPDTTFLEYDKQTHKLLRAGAAPYRSALHLTGKQQFFRGHLHFEVDGGRWLSDQDASRIDPARRMPAWGKNGERWLDVNVTKQTLVAYEGEKPVFATLISSGEAGLDDPAHSTATKRGIFRIHTKHISTTMSSDEVGEQFELRDVPYVQYFEDGYALHGAYWHDRFGVPKSHGCINLAPEDARRLFYFTEPAVPAGWHARLLPLKGTVVFVHP
ncbi:MAG TPA: L,D-transpeptidase [Polyangiaceae bacterium]